MGSSTVRWVRTRSQRVSLTFFCSLYFRFSLSLTSPVQLLPAHFPSHSSKLPLSLIQSSPIFEVPVPPHANPSNIRPLIEIPEFPLANPFPNSQSLAVHFYFLSKQILGLSSHLVPTLSSLIPLFDLSPSRFSRRISSLKFD